MIIKQNVLFGTFKISKDQELIKTNLPNNATLILKTKNEDLIDLNKYVGCFIDISRTPINQDIEVYKILGGL